MGAAGFGGLLGRLSFGLTVAETTSGAVFLSIMTTVGRFGFTTFPRITVGSTYCSIGGLDGIK